MRNSDLSRREFLKLASTGSLAIVLSELHLTAWHRGVTTSPIRQGRITSSGMPLYNAPAFNSTEIYNFLADEVVDVISIEENGEQGNPFNSTWYQVKEGFTYSGWVQPIETNYQTPIVNIPEKDSWERSLSRSAIQRRNPSSTLNAAIVCIMAAPTG